MAAKQEMTFWASKKRQENIVSWILYLIAWAGALVFVIPLVWMIVTSLKTPDDIFTIPPKWIPVSEVWLNYDPQIKAQRDGKIKMTKGEEGGKVITVESFSHVIPAVAMLEVADKETVSKGQVLAEMPREGVVRISQNTGSRDKGVIVAVLDKKSGLYIKSYNLPQGATLLVKDGDKARVGQKLANIGPQWRNYAKAWAPEALDETFNRYLLNTLIITVIGILGVLLSSTFVAYGFARFRFPGRDLMFLIMVSTMMIPVQVTMIPTFILFKWMGWIDTFAPLIVPTFFGGGAFNIFLMRQFFMTIPYELDDAAKIDGCNYFQIFWIILMPLVKPALATTAIFGFVYNWNDFLNPLIYLNSTSNYTLALGLQTFTTMYGTDYNLMMAASTIVLLPILITFFFGQRYFIEGVATSGLKG
jgi:ABC-type glycerol-3-phosphate transport system permease component